MPLMPGSPGSSQGDSWKEQHLRLMQAIKADAERNQHLLGRPQLSPAVAMALAAVARHEFVPSEYRHRAYENNPLPIGKGQTISQPTIVAFMTDLLRVTDADTVLEVGTGSGYQAAVLAELTDEVLDSFCIRMYSMC